MSFLQNGMTGLMLCIEYGEDEAAKGLVESGANVNIQDHVSLIVISI